VGGLPRSGISPDRAAKQWPANAGSLGLTEASPQNCAGFRDPSPVLLTWIKAAKPIPIGQTTFLAGLCSEQSCNAHTQADCLVHDEFYGEAGCTCPSLAVFTDLAAGSNPPLSPNATPPETPILHPKELYAAPGHFLHHENRAPTRPLNEGEV
jgi:hypothetical protein